MYLNARCSRNCQDINAASLIKDYVILNKACDENRETNPEDTNEMRSGNMKTWSSPGRDAPHLPSPIVF